MTDFITSLDWQFGEFFNRFLSTFDWHIRDGSSLVFTKLDFWLFFLLVMLVFSFLNKNKLVRSIFLTAVSLFFFYKTSGLYMLLLIVSVCYNYYLGRRIYNTQKESKRKWIIAISAIFNVLILAYFKYAYFFTDSFNEMFNTNLELVNHFAQFGNGFFGDGTFIEKIMLPVGVSFFTFQNISYVVDIYRKEIEPVKNFFHYSFFVTFFPQLVMGPIVRARDFIPQISKPYQLNKTDFSWAVIQIVKGLIKKIVIADFLVVHLINKIVFDFEAYPGFVSVIAMWAYSIHIYTDFSGYTDIAIGLSRLMGFKLKPNFNSPYKARSVAEFWRRWHISLGSWLKDYLYIPLGGNRTGGIGSYIAILFIFTFLIFITQWWELLWVYGGLTIVYLMGVALFTNFKKYVHRDLNLIITMVIGGLWHGPSENFVIWGAMNGVALVTFKYWSKISAFFNGKLRYWHFLKPAFALAIYAGLIQLMPSINHLLINVFFALWIALTTFGLFGKIAWKPIAFIVQLRIHLILFILSVCAIFTYTGLTTNQLIHTNSTVLYSLISIVGITGLFAYLNYESKGHELYERTKSRYLGFWPMLVTFNFITLTRIWFKLDEARISAFNEGGLPHEKANALPGKMLQHIWYRFEFDWSYFWRFWDMFEVPLLIMIAGFAIHWLPNKFKGLYEKAYTALPVVLQIPVIAIIIFLLYQAIGAEQPPFVYLQF
jgi:alginate O-acetyltransferase complex protein AlgI